MPALLAALVAGGLMAAGFPPLNWHPPALVAMVPLLIILPRIGSGWAWVCGFVAGLAYYRLGVAWLFGIYGGLAGLCVIGLAVWMGFAFRVARMLTDRHPARLLWAMPLAFVGHEVLRCEGLRQLRFPYLAYGYSQADNLWLVQIASLGGVYGLSLLLVSFNAAVAHGLRRHCLRAWVPAAVLTLVMLGLAVVAQPSPADTSRPVRVAGVQAETEDARGYFDLITEAAGNAAPPDFIVLPEHAFAQFINAPSPLYDRLFESARRHSVYLCVGAHARANPQAECCFDNVAALIDPSGQLLGTQAKSVPVPFMSDGNPAREQQVFDTPFGRIGMLVCYDSDFSDVPRRLTIRGAELLLVPVMNPETWPVQQREQQARIAAIRSIELRRWSVRAASSGISQIVGPDGRTLAARTQAEGPGIIRGTVYPYAELTPFVRGGHGIATATGWAFIGVVVYLTLHPLVARCAGWRRRWLPEPHEVLLSND